jgi:hypothetical protein
MIDNINPYGDHDISKLKEIWEPRKEYIEKDLWVIRNILSEEELIWLNKEAEDPDCWYTTMRSPYGGNVKNKFIGYIPDYDINGNMLVPADDSKYRDVQELAILDVIDNRLAAVVPEKFAGAGAIQSFFEVPDEQIIAELGHNVDYAMDWHYEQDHSVDDHHTGTPLKTKIEDNIQTAAISVYINTNYDGGILEFKHKNYSISPEAGMLVNIPIYAEFEHRVTKVTNGNRHALYGHSWLDLSTRHYSTNEDC